MGKELVSYNYYDLSVDHEFFARYDFWERLSYVSQVVSPEYMRDDLYQADLTFVKAVMRGDIDGAYKALCDRYEATGRSIEDGPWFSGDEAGPATLVQCLEFADFWQIDDPRLGDMRKDCELLEFIHAYENPMPGEMEAIRDALDDLENLQN